MNQTPGPSTVVFLQSPADASRAITLSRLAKDRGMDTVFVVVNVKSLYEFLAAALPSVAIYFVPHILQPMPRTPWGLFLVWRRLRKYYALALCGRRITEAWYFCGEADAVTPYFLKRLSASTRIFIDDHYKLPEVRERKWTPYLALKWLYLRIATGVSFGFCRELRDAGGRKIYRTSFDPAECGALPASSEPTISCFQLPVQFHPPVVILMDANDQDSSDIDRYADEVSTLIAELRSRNISILLKAHPRTGSSQFLENFQLTSLPSGCPLELFDMNEISAVIALNSMGLSAAARMGIAAISLLYIVAFKHEENREYWREWIDRHSNQKVRFPVSICEAVDMIAGRPSVQPVEIPS